MHVIFLSNDPVNSVVVNKDTREVLYNIVTPFSLMTHKTTIYDRQGQEVAYYKRRTLEPDEIRLRGRVLDVSGWLQREGVFSNSRRFTAPNGRTYKWKELGGSSKFQLVDVQTRQTVALSYGSRIGIFSSPRDMGIEVSDALISILDAIVLSFIIMEQKRRERRRSSGNSAMFAAQTSAAAAGAAC
ncbi:hypothetical protein OH77DRAFT_1413677 [Trametes cingulata]|nr:hypothetical protein OH77DRAFT_1413677 [Trametes cingulata]